MSTECVKLVTGNGAAAADSSQASTTDDDPCTDSLPRQREPALEPIQEEEAKAAKSGPYKRVKEATQKASEEVREEKGLPPERGASKLKED